MLKQRWRFTVKQNNDTYGIYRAEYNDGTEEVFFGLLHNVLKTINNIPIENKILSGGSYDTISEFNRDVQFLRELNEDDVLLTEV
ncbi:hypothetical protein CON36_32250 [Bacillus cereus]|uniref:Uncharacterized protein n=2 Tax=Bacillus cereus group TaxID=86661 RepID=A0A9X6ST73_BACCE|nr:hypothetical protein [Bacillus thuringiensis]PDZ94725.1 hypothetical protein CON36_32250 [Bacillus cereus]PFJ42717.1 hypothetical protein COJ15_05085 [Bacillus thuringiensis]PGP21030.1 hypothetical protein COA01_15945 [Bacillus cereus]